MRWPWPQPTLVHSLWYLSPPLRIESRVLRVAHEMQQRDGLSETRVQKNMAPVWSFRGHLGDDSCHVMGTLTHTVMPHMKDRSPAQEESPCQLGCKWQSSGQCVFAALWVTWSQTYSAKGLWIPDPQTQNKGNNLLIFKATDEPKQLL